MTTWITAPELTAALERALAEPRVAPYADAIRAAENTAHVARYLETYLALTSLMLLPDGSPEWAGKLADAALAYRDAGIELMVRVGAPLKGRT